MSQPVWQPIFVVGTGRSGSTLFFDILARHPNLAWLSILARDFPRHPWLNAALMRARSIGLVDQLLGQRLGTSEAYPFWDIACPGFSNPCRDLVADDVGAQAAERLRSAFARMTNDVRNRFAAKITGWPRIRFLAGIFPDALFIEVRRDLRATASSLLEVPWWDGWRGPPCWRRGALPADLDAIWREEGRSFVALAAIDCILMQRAMDECRPCVDRARMHAVEYAELCADPVGVLRKAVAFCHLDWSPRLAREIGRKRPASRDDGWRSRLTPAQQSVLQRTFDRGGVQPTSAPTSST